MATKEGVAPRYGIAEWFGRPFENLTQSERQARAEGARRKAKQSGFDCPFRSRPASPIPCSKKEGVCSLALYELTLDGSARRLQKGPGDLVSLCPHRFSENGDVIKWVADVMLGVEDPVVVNEIDFLMPIRKESDVTGSSRDEGVGRIDSVLMAPHLDPLRWCALEIQAVYFSGPAMSKEFAAIVSSPDGVLPFPKDNRRPDFRSSGPKRLMPQLQIKIPSLRRWGKKMAVVVDRAFFHSLGPMDPVDDPSNADIAWFVVDYQFHDQIFRLVRDEVRFTTLERAVEGLTAGKPLSLAEFEKKLLHKLNKRAR